MIISEQIDIPKTISLSSDYIESELAKLSIKPLRWAIVETTDDSFVICVSYEKDC